MKIIISVILIINFLFTPVFVFASEVESSSSTSSSDSFSLGDVVRGGGGHGYYNGQFADFVGYTGDLNTFNPFDYIKQPVLTVLSSISATTPTVIDDIASVLMNNTDFLDAIFINSTDKTLFWGRKVYDIAEPVLKSYFYNEVHKNVPDGFYPCDYTSFFTKENEHGFFVGDYPTYYTHIGNGVIILCSFYSKDNSVRVHIRKTVGPLPVSNDSGSEEQSFVLENFFTFNHVIYRYAQSLYFRNWPLLPPVVFDSAEQACTVFYGFKPIVTYESNGVGYDRPLSDESKLVASSFNVYKNDWPDIINNNYLSFGDSFSSSVINNYYYTALNTDTPSYWYDIYNNDTVSVPTYDYDLDDLTLSSPELTTNNNFLNTLFGAFPFALSGLFLALLMLSAVIIFLRG